MSLLRVGFDGNISIDMEEDEERGWRVGVFVTSNGLGGEEAVVKLTSRNRRTILKASEDSCKE